MTVPDMPTALGSHQLRALSGGRLMTPPAERRTARDNVIDFPGYQRSA